MIQAVQDAILAPTAYNAWEKWRYYVAACKKEPKNKTYLKLRKIYNEVKNGKKVIDLRKAIRAGGVSNNFMPHIGIARVGVKVCYCYIGENGYCAYDNNQRLGYARINLPNLFEPFGQKRSGYGFSGTALVPSIPSEYKDKLRNYKSDDYLILWEVKKWDNVLPEDPYLLRKLTDEMYVIEAEWDLTEIERIIMQRDMY